MSNNLPAVLTIKEVAEYLRRSTKTIRRRIQSGDIRYYKEGHEYRFRREWVLDYEQRLISNIEA